MPIYHLSVINYHLLTNELLYQLALTEVPNIGCVHAKILAQEFGSAEKIFKAKQHLLEKIEGIGEIRAKAIKAFNNFSNVEEEIKFLEKYKIKPLFLTDKNYPQRLLNCYDSPTLLFYKGDADLNASKVVAIIGTRNNTEYGKQQTEKLVNALIAFALTSPMPSIFSSNCCFALKIFSAEPNSCARIFA